MRTENVFDKLAKNVLVALAEPAKETFRTRSGQVGAVTRTLRALEHDQVKDFASPKGRDDFLWAVTEHLQSLHHEELIVAIGSRRGRGRNAGAALRSVHRTVGTRDRVALTPKLLSILEQHLTRENAEIILVHNHPPHPLKSFVANTIGWRPVPSDADRDLAVQFLRNRLGHLLTAIRPSSFKWYLVDEGQIGEFFLPAFDSWMDMAAFGMRKDSERQ